MWPAETVLVCALALLGRGADTFPAIRLVAARPPDVSAAAEGYVRDGAPVIYLLTSSSAFTEARGALDRCGRQRALTKIASVVVHEEWHVRHGGDESGAYHAQLLTLIQIGAGPGSPLYSEVSRSMAAALHRGP